MKEDKHAYLLPNRLRPDSHAAHVHFRQRTVSENLGKSVHIDAKLLNRGNKKKQVDGEIALHVHIGAEELVRSEVLVGEDKLPTVNAVSMTYSLGMMLVFTMLFPISESKSV